MRNNKLATFALIALAATSSASFAQSAYAGQYGDATVSAGTAFTSTRSRADVITELQQSKNAVLSGEVGGAVNVPFTSSLTRAAVRSELQNASVRGEVLHGEASVTTAGLSARTSTGKSTSLNTVTQPALSNGLASVRSGEAYIQDATPFVSTRTRADVKAELQQALAHGAVQSGEAYHTAATPAGSTRSRAEVKAELRDALAHGEVQSGDAYGIVGRANRQL